MSKFKVISKFNPSGDQEQAIDKLTSGILDGQQAQTLLGITGSGKTYTMAKVIERVQKPSLILTHNKTLAAQLYREFTEFFPENAVEYFVSYYDYYQPEAYVISSDLYIEKDSSVNDEINRLRLKATSSILERDDVIVVSSVSCIYGLGTPDDYEKSHIRFSVGDSIDRDDFIKKLIHIYYERNNVSFTSGTFRVRGDIIEIIPAYIQQQAIRIEFFGDEIDAISEINPIDGKIINRLEKCYIYPAKHFITSPDEMAMTIQLIREELGKRLKQFKSDKKLVEAQRLESRTNYDIEMLLEMGYCNGIENYSRIISRRNEGDRPACLLDYFKGNYMMFIDESHVSLPQVRGMYMGDRSRKINLVDHGFRLPSALDNRPLFFKEFEEIVKQVIYVSATPSDYELKRSTTIAEQVIRPTGLLDPIIEVRPAKNQVDDLIGEINTRSQHNERILVTTLTKKMAEDLTGYLDEAGINARYLHSEINTMERVEIIRDLRKGDFDCLVGINLLREGLDLPEVSLVAIFDADKEGFLRSATSLTQTAGRAARNINGKVIMYADRVTDSMQKTIDITNKRRSIQEKYNSEHNITPETIKKEVVDIIERHYESEKKYTASVADYSSEYNKNNLKDLNAFKERLHEDMLKAAQDMEFEYAAMLRDKMRDIEKKIKLMEKVKND